MNMQKGIALVEMLSVMVVATIILLNYGFMVDRGNEMATQSFPGVVVVNGSVAHGDSAMPNG